MTIDLQFFTDLAYAALAVLVAVLAIYLALRLLGKFAKYLITLVLIALVLWFLFSNRSILQYVWGFLGGAKDKLGELTGAALRLLP